MKKFILFGLFILLLCISTATAIDLEKDLVVYYSFDDGTAKDNSGNGNDGVIYGAKVVDGIKGKALYFDGVNDYVEIPKINLESGDGLTIAGWVNLKDYKATLFSNGEVTPGWDNGIRKFLINKYKKMCVQVETSNFNSHCSPPIPDANLNEWHHWVLVFDFSSNMNYFYFDGEQIDSWYGNVKGCLNTNEIHALGRVPKGPSYIDGTIDEVRIYNRALSEEEIKALYGVSTTSKLILSLNIDIDTLLKQGEIRKGILTVKNEGNADAKFVKAKLSSESLGINVEKSYVKIPAGEAREFVFEVNANDAGTFKLSAYAEYWDDEGNKYVETSEEYIHVEAIGDVTEKKSITPGFEAIFAIIGLILVTYTYLRRKKR